MKHISLRRIKNGTDLYLLCPSFSDPAATAFFCIMKDGVPVPLTNEHYEETLLPYGYLTQGTERIAGKYNSVTHVSAEGVLWCLPTYLVGGNVITPEERDYTINRGSYLEEQHKLAFRTSKGLIEINRSAPSYTSKKLEPDMLFFDTLTHTRETRYDCSYHRFFATVEPQYDLSTHRFFKDASLYGVSRRDAKFASSKDYILSSRENYIPARLGIVNGHLDRPLDIVTPRVARPQLPEGWLQALLENLHLKPNMNNLENLGQIKELGALAKILRKNPTIKWADLTLRTLASARLMYKYSYSTTKMDFSEAISFLTRKRCADKVSSSKYYNIDGWTMRISIVGASDPFNVLDKAGLMPNASNLWDMVPFSFVLDWFCSVGDVFAALDADRLRQQMTVDLFMTSMKRADIVTVPGYSGTIQVTQYLRTVGSTIPMDYVRLHAKDPGSHLIDGAALLIANIK